MRILAISRAPWRNDNSTGNTFTNLFQDFTDAEIYSLCMREQPPQNNIALRNFCISEGQLLRNLLHKTPVGTENTAIDDSGNETEKNIYDKAKKNNSVGLSLARELLWSVGKWKNENLKAYIKEVNPDIIFFPVFNCFYPHKILKYIKSLTDAPVILFHVDDNYTLRQFSLSPMYWLYRFMLRKWVRSSVRLSALNYVISDVQKQDYEKAFRKECKVLTKSADFATSPAYKTDYNSPLQLVFTGNIGLNRWKSLAIIAKALQILNADGLQAQLRIYTGTPLSEKMKSALQIEDTSFIMGSVPASEIPEIQREADMLVHVEAFDLHNRLYVRQSFSTKLVDYFKTARPILAVGPFEVASMAHLIQNDCALTAETAEELAEKLTAVITVPENLDVLAQQAYLCGKNHHDKAKINKMLREDFAELINKSDA